MLNDIRHLEKRMNQMVSKLEKVTDKFENTWLEISFQDGNPMLFICLGSGGIGVVKNKTAMECEVREELPIKKNTRLLRVVEQNEGRIEIELSSLVVSLKNDDDELELSWKIA